MTLRILLTLALLAALSFGEAVVISSVSLPVNGAGSVSLVLDSAPNGLSGYEIVVTVEPQVAEIVDVQFPQWAKLSQKEAVPGGVKISAVDLEDAIKPGAVNVPLATLVVRGVGSGEGRIKLTVRMDDDRGNPINPRVEGGIITITTPSPTQTTPTSASPTTWTTPAATAPATETYVVSRRQVEASTPPAAAQPAYTQGGAEVIAAAVLIAGALIGAAVLVARGRQRGGSPPQPMAAGQAYLVLPNGAAISIPSQGREFGRSDFEPYLPPDVARYISARHFRVFNWGGQWYVEDLGSTNGTLVDGVEIKGRGPTPLRNGSEIAPAGLIKLYFRTS